jgi:hypothetical protein
MTLPKKRLSQPPKHPEQRREAQPMPRKRNGAVGVVVDAAVAAKA